MLSVHLLWNIFYNKSCHDGSYLLLKLLLIKLQRHGYSQKSSKEVDGANQMCMDMVP